MKTLLIFVCGLLLLTAGCADDSRDGNKLNQGDTIAVTYTCPMHPSVVSDTPGACPVCGMSLVKKSEQAALSAEEEEHFGHISLSPAQRVLAHVTSQEAVLGEVTKIVPLVGFVQVAEPLEATVAARFRGRIERVYASTTGEQVKAGSPLFDLYSPDLVTSVQEFILALNSTSSREGADPASLDGFRARLRLHYGMTSDQIADIEATRKIRPSVTFNSPQNGTILAKDVREGDYVNEGEVLYRVADLSKVWIMLDVYEQDVRHFSIGQTVVLTANAYPGEKFSGRITFIDPVMHPTTRTTRVRTEFNNAHGKLKPNMFVSASVEVRESGKLVVPRAAVLETGRRSLVWVETTSNTFEPRAVSVGMRGDRLVEISSGLSAGEKVASSGGFLIDSESSLQYGMTDATPQETASRPDANGIVNITVQGAYTPDVIRVQKGLPVRLRFFRNEQAMCTQEIVFPELGIRRSLAAFDTTEIRITPTEAGTIYFSCGMDMVHGQLIVE